MLFPYKITGSDFESEVEIPNGNDPDQNAWLTIRLNYSLDFADSRNKVSGIIIEQGGKCYAKDFDGFLFPILDWDFNSCTRFAKQFAAAEKIWNWQFTLITPKHYKGLDYESWRGDLWYVRPNVLCLFRLVAGGTPNHRPITVVRPDPTVTEVVRFDNPKVKKKVNANSFRSHSRLYDYLDVWSATLGHEMGHALGMPHIKELKGDAQCIADAKAGKFPDRCYGETEEERRNIMGGGKEIAAINAKPWLDRIHTHTGVAKTQWKVSLDMKTTKPRKIPLEMTIVDIPEF